MSLTRQNAIKGLVALIAAPFVPRAQEYATATSNGATLSNLAPVSFTISSEGVGSITIEHKGKSVTITVAEIFDALAEKEKRP